MPSGKIIEEPEVVDKDKNNGKSPRGIEPANHLGVQNLVELCLNGLKTSSRDLLVSHADDRIISPPNPSRNPLSGSSRFKVADLNQAEPTKPRLKRSHRWLCPHRYRNVFGLGVAVKAS